MDLPEPAGDPLTQPTRASLFSCLEQAKRPLSSEELARKMSLHVNGVRRHLEQLRAAGLVERRRVSGGQGRPHDRWSISPQADPGGRPPRAYAELSRWLARVIPAGASRLRQIERSGREIGRDLVPSDSEQSARGFVAALAALGFQPELELGADGSACCRLGNCPYRESVRENAEVVCTLHRGITTGLLDRLAPGARLSTFEPRDPDLAGCAFEVTGTSWEPRAEPPAALS